MNNRGELGEERGEMGQKTIGTFDMGEERSLPPKASGTLTLCVLHRIVIMVQPCYERVVSTNQGGEGTRDWNYVFRYLRAYHLEEGTDLKEF